jgi:hypothetical protein
LTYFSYGYPDTGHGEGTLGLLLIAHIARER